MSPPQGDMHCPKRMSRVASQRTVGGLSQKINEAQKGALPFFNGNGMDNYGNLLGDQDNKSKARVSFLKLLSFSTPKERWLMVLGVFCATVSGFGLPVWLILLARALDTFSSLAVLIEEVGGDALYDYLRTELNNLCVAFAILGFVCLVSGTLYVGIWTYTGEKQSLRIRKAFVRGALNQDAGWFDENDRNELPSMMGTSLMHINHAIGRHMVDTYALGISAAGALGVALALNSQLTLIMLCAFPVVIVMMLIFNWFIRKAKKQANKELGLAGSIATECISGIKTVAAFCSQSTFGQQYDEHVNEAQRLSVRGHFLAAFLAGLTGLLFYSVYTGTQLVFSSITYSFQLLVTNYHVAARKC
jgi:ATP-binding cassette subfamily B (MDR/TAP) protein 1